MKERVRRSPNNVIPCSLNASVEGESRTAPADLTSEQKSEKDKLSKLSGAAFDKEYMSAMVEDHDKDVKAFQDKAKDAKDADLKAFVTKTLPTLEEHQRMAKEIKGKQ